jgi:hypothetical protein
MTSQENLLGIYRNLLHKKEKSQEASRWQGREVRLLTQVGKSKEKKNATRGKVQTKNPRTSSANGERGNQGRT